MDNLVIQRILVDNFGFEMIKKSNSDNKYLLVKRKIRLYFDGNNIYLLLNGATRHQLPSSLDSKMLASLLFYGEVDSRNRLFFKKEVLKGSHGNIINIYEWLSDFKDLKDFKFGKRCNYMSFLFDEIDAINKTIIEAQKK